MNLIIKSTEKKSRGPVMKSGIIQPPNKAFVDDMTIATKSVVEGRWALQELTEVITWARMKFKPSKSRSLAIVKGKVCNQYRFKIHDEWIPTLAEKPIRCLGKWYRITLNDKASIAETHSQLSIWLVEVEECGLPGKFKIWIYQHGILPRILWPLLVYEIPISDVEKMETLSNRYLKKWLGVPKSFSSVGLFSTSSKLQLPLKAVTDEYKKTKARQIMLLEASRDQCVRQAGVQIDAGRKWKASNAIEEAKQRLRHKDIVGTVSHGRQGLGTAPRQSWQQADAADRRQLVQSEIAEKQEEQRVARAASMSNQGSWLNWQNVQGKKLSWNEIRAMEPYRISFLLRSVYDLLPTPSNLALWNIRESPNCTLCDKPANLKHVLSSCQTALTGGRYTWRHNRVLTEIAHHLTLALNAKRKHHTGPVFINFVKQGTAPSSRATGLLPTATDWELLVDLKSQLKFPPEIAVTRKRPDMVLWSKMSKQVVIIELTVPWEEGIEEAYERKMLSYTELVQECRSKGWKTWCLPIEIGCRGFAGQSIWRCMKILGIVGKTRRTLIRSAENAAEYASRWLFEKRESRWQTQEDKEEPVKQKRGGCQPLNKPKHPRKVVKMQKNVVNTNITFFFGYKMPFSNFYPCSFQVQLPEPYGLKTMHSVEQLYMIRKSLYFEDHATCTSILNSTNARDAKKLGSKVDKFVPDLWLNPKKDVMRECLVRKFVDSREAEFLQQQLLDAHAIIIEASPPDSYWGIGFSKQQGPYVQRSDWGSAENWLGRLLMEMQQFLRSLHSLDPNTQESHTYYHIYRKVRRQVMFSYSPEAYASHPTPHPEPFNTFLDSTQL